MILCRYILGSLCESVIYSTIVRVTTYFRPGANCDSSLYGASYTNDTNFSLMQGFLSGMQSRVGNYCSILLRLHRSFKLGIGLDEASCPEAGGSRPGCTSVLSAQRGSNEKNTAQKLLSTQDVKGGLKLFLLPLVLAHWAEVEGNDCDSGTMPQVGSNRPEVPTTQLAKMSIDSKFAELTADVLRIFF